MNRKQRACLITGFLLLAVAAFAEQQASQAPKPAGKVTASKPIPCSQRLKVQTDANAELSDRVEFLERESDTWRNRANELLASYTESSNKSDRMLKEKDNLIEKQRKLLEQYSAVSRELAGEMIASDVSGNWTIQTPTGRTICYVQLFEVSHVIQLTNCHY
jgi:predicted RNase H-like nuclease (RuvC/YqgF family)